MEMVRKPAVAGMFYPNDRRELGNVVSVLLDQAVPEQKFNVNGLIAPHAGYVYSGKTAAYGYSQIKGKKFSTVIILSPSHREYFDGVCIYEGDAYLTPLGRVPVDHEISDALCTEDDLIYRGINGHGPEHAIEVQLPFLQSVLGEFNLVPVVMGDQSEKNINTLAEKLSAVMRDDILVIASSDLSHFYSHEHADEMDAIAGKHINNFDFDALQRDLDDHRTEACGGGLITTMLKAYSAKGFDKARVLYRNDSSEASGDKSEVVGYLTAVVYK